MILSAAAVMALNVAACSGGPDGPRDTGKRNDQKAPPAQTAAPTQPPTAKPPAPPTEPTTPEPLADAGQPANPEPLADAGKSVYQTCLDFADALAKASARCGWATYEDEYAGQKRLCPLVSKIRDESSLRQTCIPSLETISCEDLRANKTDPSCQNPVS
ncbi:hypothetical protein LVJ94_20325 [Pendulispora rubella]|uniref:Uncharacterized protein n=1 Tax=Pendulispora rubella TaxID=2741070 RepID=A0ABZ2LF50_9BACT